MKKYISIIFLILSTYLTNTIIKTTDIPISVIKEKMHLSQADLDRRGENEIKGFVDSNVWKGGYYEGDPLNPSGGSSYHVAMPYHGSKLNPLYICFAECIRPYVNSATDILEIGPGWGTWTKSMLTLNPRTIVCLDTLSAEHNKFWNHIGYRNNVQYLQIKNFSLAEIKDNSIDFIFSFGTFCHISSLMCYEYFKNLFKKLRNGGQGFIMYADYDKKNLFAQKYNMPNHSAVKTNNEIEFFIHQDTVKDFMPTWYHLGRDRAYSILIELGYEVIASDININERDPIIHFRKP